MGGTHGIGLKRRGSAIGARAMVPVRMDRGGPFFRGGFTRLAERVCVCVRPAEMRTDRVGIRVAGLDWTRVVGGIGQAEPTAS
jgi:hypothetical protein